MCHFRAVNQVTSNCVLLLVLQVIIVKQSFHGFVHIIALLHLKCMQFDWLVVYWLP
jgi:hypothetical protein